MTAASKDRRYQGSRWTKTSRRVRLRDRDCYMPGCTRGAQVADHIFAVYVGMPDAEFYDESNLRGACRIHNVARGFAALVSGEPAPRRRSRFSVGTGQHERHSSISLPKPRSLVVTRDFSRKATAHGAG